MIDYFFDCDFNIVALLGILGAFILTCFCLHTFMGKLPKDLGRDFAHNGKLSAGKPRGAGFIFILVFSVAAVLTGKLNTELIIYLILVIAAMMTGFLDDCSRAPWGELKKGLLDFVIAVMLAVTYLNFNSSDIYMVTINQTVHINPILFGVLAVILIWVSINVTNCADGVDGLSGTLTIVTLMSIYVINKMLYIDSSFSYFILLFVICILGYLWYNATPSVLMMGDAGSRAMGLFISIAILKTGCPLLLYSACNCAYIRWWTRSFKSFTFKIFKNSYYEKCKTSISRSCKESMELVKYTVRIQICHNSGSYLHNNN